MPKSKTSTHPNAAAFPKGIAGPALRALANAGITSMAQLTRWPAAKLATLHGMGPKAIAILKARSATPAMRSGKSKTATTADTRAIKAQIARYRAGLTPKGRRELAALRSAIVAAAPDAVDAFSYGIPGFRLDGRILVWYAGWTEHSSLYPVTAGMRAAGGATLKGYALSKGTIRFPLDAAIPSALVTRMVKGRVAELRPVAKKKRSS